MSLSEDFLSHFGGLEDPRTKNHNFRHLLEDILAITILGTLCGADNWIEISAFAASKEAWLRTFLSLPNGIPSHDTLSRVFSGLDSERFEACFMEWAGSLSVLLPPPEGKRHIAIDGKTLRGAHNRSKGRNPLHLVSAWASGQQLLLGQVKSEAKSNEIEAMPRLLKMLDIRNCIVTIDAMGCQSAIAEQIIEQKGDYILTLKDNQPTLAEAAANIFTVGEQTQYKDMHNLRKIEKVRAHGRIETRKYTLISCKDSWVFDTRWPGLRSIGMLQVKRTVGQETTLSTRYFLTSLTYQQMDEFMRAARNHWDIEINLHWSLDVSFNEDHNRVRTGNASQNLAIVRRIALNLLKQDKSTKSGISAKRKKAGWDNNYLIHLCDRKI